VRVLKVLVGLTLVLALLVGAGLLVLVRYVDSDAFRQAVVAAARNALGVDVHIGEMHVSLLAGATLRGVRVASPTGSGDDLLSAQALIVRPRLLPLLRRRLEIREMRLEAPAVTLARLPGGGWAHEHLGSRTGGTPPGPAPPSGHPSAPPEGPPIAPGLDVIVPRLALRGGSLVVLNERARPVVRLSGIELSTSLSRLGGVLAGEGRLEIASIRLADRVEAKALVAPLRFQGGELELAPLRAQLAQGTLTGDASVALAGPTRYAATLDLADARAEALLGAMGHRSVAGRVRARARFSGTAAGATGEGHAEIREGQLLGFPVLGAIATALDLPLLRDLRFEAGAVDFLLAGDVLRTPAVRFTARDVRILGRGEVALRTGTLAHELTLLVPPAAVRRAPREVRAAFTERPGGLMGIDFRVFGPYQAPRTDLPDRALGGLAESMIRKGLRQLFR
jgi:hypothetical protein